MNRFLIRICGAAIVCGSLVATPRARAADRSPAAILKEIDAVKEPTLDAEMKDAMTRKAELIGELYRADPDNTRLVKLLPERWQTLFPMRTRREVSRELADELNEVITKARSDELKKDAAYWKALFVFFSAPDDAAKLKAVDEFTTFAPKDERGAELLTMLSRMPSFRLRRSYGALKALYQRIGDQYPGSRSAELARGSVRRLDAVGKPFDLEFIEAISGSQVSMKDLRGKAVVIDFWSTSCSACVGAVPKMKKLYAEFKEKGLEIIGVNLDAPKEYGGLDKLKEFVKKEGIPWPQYYQGDGWHSAFSTSWGIHFLPAVFVVDSEGKLYSVEARGKLETIIPKLLNRPDPKAGESRR